MSISLTPLFSHCREVEGLQALQENAEELVPWEERFVWTKVDLVSGGQARPAPQAASASFASLSTCFIYTSLRLCSGLHHPASLLRAAWPVGTHGSCSVGWLSRSRDLPTAVESDLLCREPWPQFSISGNQNGAGRGEAHSTAPDLLNTHCLNIGGPHGCSAGHVELI